MEAGEEKRGLHRQRVQGPEQGEKREEKNKRDFSYSQEIRLNHHNVFYPKVNGTVNASREDAVTAVADMRKGRDFFKAAVASGALARTASSWLRFSNV